MNSPPLTQWNSPDSFTVLRAVDFPAAAREVRLILPDFLLFTCKHSLLKSFLAKKDVESMIIGYVLGLL
jgi:hypothetical protein